MKTVLITTLLSVQIFAQSFSGGFNFNLPPNDTTTSAFLPEFPVMEIHNDDFVTINNDGHFTVKGNQIRFWGGNIVAGAAFPDKNKVWFIAGRLRKLGFNLIRFHHIDNGWGTESLFEYGSGKDTRHLNPATFDRLEYLIAELKKNGIYLNMNLNVSRDFKTADGVPDADSLVEFAKGVTQFDPYLIELQKEYANQLLTHINPYTGQALINDPVMAMVEVANENSLYRIWRDNKLKSFSEGGWLPIRHVQMLDSMWNSFLKNTYTNNNDLAASWNQGISPGNSSNQVKNGNFEEGDITTYWDLELHNGAIADTTRVGDYLAGQGAYSAKVTVTNATGTAWHIQWKHIGLTVKKDSFYTVEFYARAEKNQNIHVAVMRDNSPWTYYSGQDFLINDTWTPYTFSFKAPEDNFGQVRLTFQFPETGEYRFDMMRFGDPVKNGLLRDESLEKQNVKRIDFSQSINFSDNRVKDISEFYIQLQKNYFQTMKEYLVNTLGVKVPIIGTNWNVGAADLSIQSTMDYIDNHSYWDHPSFPNEPWSSTDWFINNTPMVSQLNSGTIPDLFAGVAMEGKPYTISEYNHAFPNRYQVEAPLFISAYSSFHYADGIMFFDYNGENSWETDKINSYFSINRNNVLMALMPSCAYAFRYNLVAPAKETLLVNYSPDKIKLFPKDDPGGWQSYSLYSKKLALLHAIRNQSFESSSTTDFSIFPPDPINPYVTDTKEIIYNTNGLFTINTAKFVGITGHLNNFSNAEVKNLKLKSANDFGAITWLSLTEDSLSVSEKSLITISSKIQNTGMTWDGTQTIHNNWGSQPTQVFPLDVSLELKIFADSIYIYPLDTRGKESPVNFSVYHPVVPNYFEINIDQNINKTLWFGIRKFGNGDITGISNEILPNEYKLEQNYPNPFNPTTNFEFGVADFGLVRLKIFDILGNEIAVIVNEELPAGSYNYSWSAAGLASGVYFYEFNAGGFKEVKKMILMR